MLIGIAGFIATVVLIAGAWVFIEEHIEGLAMLAIAAAIGGFAYAAYVGAILPAYVTVIVLFVVGPLVLIYVKHAGSADVRCSSVAARER